MRERKSEREKEGVCVWVSICMYAYGYGLPVCVGENVSTRQSLWLNRIRRAHRVSMSHVWLFVSRRASDMCAGENVCTVQRECVYDTESVTRCVWKRESWREAGRGVISRTWMCVWHGAWDVCAGENVCTIERECVRDMVCETECVYDRERMGVRYRVSD